MSLVCQVDGVPVARTRGGALLHIDSLPEGVDPEHDVVGIASEHFMVASGRALSLADAATDMLRHHDTLHPGSDCEWARRLWDMLR